MKVRSASSRSALAVASSRSVLSASLAFACVSAFFAESSRCPTCSRRTWVHNDYLPYRYSRAEYRHSVATTTCRENNVSIVRNRSPRLDLSIKTFILCLSRSPPSAVGSPLMPVARSRGFAYADWQPAARLEDPGGSLPHQSAKCAAGIRGVLGYVCCQGRR